MGYFISWLWPLLMLYFEYWRALFMANFINFGVGYELFGNILGGIPNRRFCKLVSIAWILFFLEGAFGRHCLQAFLEDIAYGLFREHISGYLWEVFWGNCIWVILRALLKEEHCLKVYFVYLKGLLSYSVNFEGLTVYFANWGGGHFQQYFLWVIS